MRRLRRLLPVLATLAAASCDSRSQPFEPPGTTEPVIVTAAVNVQLGDTPAGQRPQYIVTGQVRAERAGARVQAVVDSVVVYYREDAATDGPWTRVGRWNAFPVAGLLPFQAVAGRRYELWAILHASSDAGTEPVTARDEWLATGTGL